MRTSKVSAKRIINDLRIVRARLEDAMDLLDGQLTQSDEFHYVEFAERRLQDLQLDLETEMINDGSY